ncbi:MAG: hypothetical protein IJI53_02580 [Clostridia bacterium]|nr:hypothetical protein [Clostridia bacterium]MBR0406901.1 hypothetical protein [Clostridia bacterium]
MRGKLNDRDAKCPFFAFHTREAIACESLIPDTKAKITFEKPKGKSLHYNLFCCFKYENCEMYQAVMKTYEEDDEKGDSLL